MSIKAQIKLSEQHTTRIFIDGYNSTGCSRILCTGLGLECVDCNIQKRKLNGEIIDISQISDLVDKYEKRK